MCCTQFRQGRRWLRVCARGAVVAIVFSSFTVFTSFDSARADELTAFDASTAVAVMDHPWTSNTADNSFGAMAPVATPVLAVGTPSLPIVVPGMPDDAPHHMPPTPSSLALLAVGLIFLVIARRRRWVVR